LQYFFVVNNICKYQEQVTFSFTTDNDKTVTKRLYFPAVHLSTVFNGIQGSLLNYFSSAIDGLLCPCYFLLITTKDVGIVLAYFHYELQQHYFFFCFFCCCFAITYFTYLPNSALPLSCIS
jgi:hypothetical protein